MKEKTVTKTKQMNVTGKSKGKQGRWMGEGGQGSKKEERDVN